jgi:hypothetical protein
MLKQEFIGPADEEEQAAGSLNRLYGYALADVSTFNKCVTPCVHWHECTGTSAAPPRLRVWEHHGSISFTFHLGLRCLVWSSILT